MSRLNRNRAPAPVAAAEEPVDKLRIGIDQHLAVCEAVREGIFNVGFIGVDFARRTAGIEVKPDNVDEIEAGLRDHFGDRYPDLIA